MSPITNVPHGGWWHAAPTASGPAARRLRTLIVALRRLWTRERYRPERRYMRG